jgi:hypothetical protein
MPIANPVGTLSITTIAVILPIHRSEPEFTWEHTDKARALGDDAGVKVA